MTHDDFQEAIKLRNEISKLKTLIEHIDNHQTLIVTFSIHNNDAPKFEIEDQGLIARIGKAIGVTLNELKEEFKKL